MTIDGFPYSPRNEAEKAIQRARLQTAKEELEQAARLKIDAERTGSGIDITSLMRRVDTPDEELLTTRERLRLYERLLRSDLLEYSQPTLDALQQTFDRHLHGLIEDFEDRTLSDLLYFGFVQLITNELKANPER